jgi:ADP-ribosylglycohydrolase
MFAYYHGKMLPFFERRGNMNQGIKPAIRSRGLLKPLPVARVAIPLAVKLSTKEYGQLQMGMLSYDMNQKWLAYVEEPWLYLHRSWSGVCMYAIRFEQIGDECHSVEAFVNGDSSQDSRSVDTCFTDSEGHSLLMQILVYQVVHQFDGVRADENSWKSLYEFQRKGVEALKAGKHLIAFQTAPETGAMDTRLLLGAIAGDVIGSSYEALGEKKFDFDLFTNWSKFTDDTVLTCAVAQSVMHGESFTKTMRRWGKRHLMAGYGQGFERWIHDDTMGPYGSSGNGSAMRVAAIGLSGKSREEVLELARKSAEGTHNHPDGIMGAQAIALAVWLALQGTDKTTIRQEITSLSGYNLNRSLDTIRPTYGWSASCVDSVPESILCFLEADNYEEAIRNAISLGGDTDTMAAMAGAIAAAYWGGVPADITRRVESLLSLDILDTVNQFSFIYPLK